QGRQRKTAVENDRCRIRRRPPHRGAAGHSGRPARAVAHGFHEGAGRSATAGGCEEDGCTDLAGQRRARPAGHHRRSTADTPEPPTPDAGREGRSIGVGALVQRRPVMADRETTPPPAAAGEAPAGPAEWERWTKKRV